MIGPAIPEGLLKKPANESEIVILFSDDEEEVVGPQIPTHILEKKRQPLIAGPQIPEHILDQKQSVGPQIPEYILQQKKSNNTDEIAISDGEDGKDNIRPQIPKHILEKKKTAEVEGDVADPDDFAPALPPDLLEQRQKQQQPAQPIGGVRRRRPVGPSFPTGPMLITQQQEEEDEYMVGPALPKDYNPEEEAKYSAIHAIEERARQAKEAMEKKVENKGKVERPEWMLAPPEVDYLKQANSSKSRQFTNNTMSKTELDSSGWTETPAQKQQRLEEQRLGKRKAVEEETNYSALDIERRRNVQEYNNQTRPLTLLELHQKNKKKSKETVEDVRNRAFDREKDLLGTRKMDRKTKNELFKQSADLGSKFGYGNSSFL